MWGWSVTKKRSQCLGNKGTTPTTISGFAAYDIFLSRSTLRKVDDCFESHSRECKVPYSELHTHLFNSLPSHSTILSPTLPKRELVQIHTYHICQCSPSSRVILRYCWFGEKKLFRRIKYTNFVSKRLISDAR
mmetsp:Transcript_4406/g.9866  ORF Transcript_4406/g.9866 Transcript_4406/m.9866 type:complete len:133 (+) Transcript_4406:1430-1828(+)